MPTSRVRQVLLLSGDLARTEAILMAFRAFHVRTALTAAHSIEELRTLPYPLSAEEGAWEFTLVDLVGGVEPAVPFLSWLRSRDPQRAVPIVCITGPLDSEVAAAYARGANSVVVAEVGLSEVGELAVVVAGYWLLLNRTTLRGSQ